MLLRYPWTVQGAVGQSARAVLVKTTKCWFCRTIRQSGERSMSAGPEMGSLGFEYSIFTRLSSGLSDSLREYDMVGAENI